MIVNKKTIMKLNRLTELYSHLIFESIEYLETSSFSTFDHHRVCPTGDRIWKTLQSGDVWGEARENLWIRGEYTVPEALAGEDLYLQAETGAVEALLLVNDEASGIFNGPSGPAVKGNHHTRLLAKNVRPGAAYSIALECYAGHPIVGMMPFDSKEKETRDPEYFRHRFKYLRICRKHQDILDFVTELKILLQIAEAEGADSFRGASIYRSLQEVFALVDQEPSDDTGEDLHSQIGKARETMQLHLNLKTRGSSPKAGIIGHSHMDTAWLWTMDETVRKCARTFSNSLSLMKEYPDYMFLQSSPYHLEMMRKNYPGVFSAIQSRVAEGRWEPNGGSWIEPDCNIPSGESLIRQFLYGQKYLQEHFNYRADTFWQPDVFGYSASIPQILSGSGIRYFLTTKLSWNEETKFPYDSFRWEGIDGTSVLTHFNTIHTWPDPKSLIKMTDEIQHKDIQRERFCAFGYGDGGGGPMFEMLEMPPYLKNLDGVPRTEYSTVSSFMSSLESRETEWPLWKGELYLELHRGTLTSIHDIKKLNRKIEILLRETEFLYTLCTLEGRVDSYPSQQLEDLWKILLRNQFHDILPGTSIGEVNKQALQELGECERELNRLNDALNSSQEMISCSVWNSLSWERSKMLLLGNIPEDLIPSDATLEWQRVRSLCDEPLLIVNNLKIPSLGASQLFLAENKEKQSTALFFVYDGLRLETNRLIMVFGSRGEIISLIEKSSERELVTECRSLNNLLIGEDIPALWDNWDIDMDQSLKMKHMTADSEWTVTQQGPLQIRLANSFKAGKSSTVRQHIILYRDSPRIDFETLVEWNERHRLLKTEFNLNIQTDSARHEIQYGHIERGTHTNLPQDRARFEVCNHQWSDLSEPDFGVALLNDCKYGISVSGTTMRLSLLKSGTHPDPSADKGTHSFTYSLLPHNGGFSTAEVIRSARELNTPLTVLREKPDTGDMPSFLTISRENIILESLKKAENGRGYIARLYETEKKQTYCVLRFSRNIRKAEECNMLEEFVSKIEVGDQKSLSLNFRGFEIKTLRLIFDES